jgi:hypothetical protein
VHLEREHRRAEKARQLAASPEESAR